MKVLSIQEPYATLIKSKQKYIETRSWKTEYRGELYIHASLSKKYLKSINSPEVLKLIEGIGLNYGNIICRVNLKDCIHMTKDYIESLKKTNNQEFQLGIYEEGRFAWVFDDIVSLEHPFPAKGKLNIWTYKEEPDQTEKVKQLKLFQTVDK